MADTALAGRIAWVTGSSRGLGRVMAEHLGRLGADVVVVVRTSVGAIRADVFRGVIVHHQESPFSASITTEYPQGVFQRGRKRPGSTTRAFVG